MKSLFHTIEILILYHITERSLFFYKLIVFSFFTHQNIKFLSNLTSPIRELNLKGIKFNPQLCSQDIIDFVKSCHTLENICLAATSVSVNVCGEVITHGKKLIKLDVSENDFGDKGKRLNLSSRWIDLTQKHRTLGFVSISDEFTEYQGAQLEWERLAPRKIKRKRRFSS